MIERLQDCLCKCERDQACESFSFQTFVGFDCWSDKDHELQQNHRSCSNEFCQMSENFENLIKINFFMLALLRRTFFDPIYGLHFSHQQHTYYYLAFS